MFYSYFCKCFIATFAGPNRHNKPAWKDIWISMTINSMNHDTVEDLTEEWIGKGESILDFSFAEQKNGLERVSRF
jgi:hypothetical protein